MKRNMKGILIKDGKEDIHMDKDYEIEYPELLKWLSEIAKQHEIENLHIEIKFKWMWKIVIN